MANTLQKRELTKEDRQIIGQLIMEGLEGEISDETRSRLKELGNHMELPAPYGHIVGYLRGYDTDGKHLADMLVDELRIVGMERLDATVEGPHPMGIDWIAIYNILEVVLEGGDRDLRDEADTDIQLGLGAPEMLHTPEWAKLLVEHVYSSKARGDDLTLELLAILESTIKARRDKLVEPTV